MKRKNSSNSVQSSEADTQRQSRGIFLIVISLVAMLGGSALTAAVMFVARPPRHSNPPPVLQGPSVQVPVSQLTFNTLLTMSAEELEGVDVAMLNLLCATGLPGSETLNVEACRATLDVWAVQIDFETEMSIDRSFLKEPFKYGGSLERFRAYTMARVLHERFGIHDDPADDPRYPMTNSKPLFIHGLMEGNHTGTDASLPFIYLAVGRRLGYPLYLVATKGHLFVRWDDGQQRFNMETMAPSFQTPNDDFYRLNPHVLNEQERSIYLKNMTTAEELAECFMARGRVLEAVGRHAEARVAFGQARRLAPSLPHSVVRLIHSLTLPTSDLPKPILETIPELPNLNPELPHLPTLNSKR